MSTPSSDAAGKPHAQRPALAAAFVDTVSVGVGMFPLGAAFGLLVVQSGLDWWWALVLSVLVYAGSMEFLAIGLLVAVTPLLRGVSLSQTPHGLPEVLAIAATVILHLLRRNAVASIIGGTAVYVLLVNLVFT